MLISVYVKNTFDFWANSSITIFFFLHDITSNIYANWIIYDS